MKTTDEMREIERSQVRLTWFGRGFLAAGLFAPSAILGSALYTHTLPYDEGMALAMVLGLGCLVSIPLIVLAFIIAGEISLARRGG